MHNVSMQVTWDPKKAKANLKKHRVRFSDADSVLSDPMAMTIEQDVEGELRFVTLGSNATGELLVVVHTYRGDTMRLISARKATPGEGRSYEEGI